jgi:hypothetical protein
VRYADGGNSRQITEVQSHASTSWVIAAGGIYEKNIGRDQKTFDGIDQQVPGTQDELTRTVRGFRLAIHDADRNMAFGLQGSGCRPTPVTRAARPFDAFFENDKTRAN